MERAHRYLDMINITVESNVYEHANKNVSLYLNILKNNKRFIHLSLHLTPKELNPKKEGMIHIYKNIYNKPKQNKSKYYALISVKYNANKPHSLHFTIDDEYKITQNANAPLYDKEIYQEMDVIITVLNRIFDEDNKDFYVGNPGFPVHNNTNKYLKIINNQAVAITRKNKGHMIDPLPSNLPMIVGNTQTKRVPTSRRITVKAHKRIL